MKKQLLPFILVCGLLTTASGAQAQTKINDGTGTPVTSLPAAGSILELQSTQAGLRIPQINLTDTKTWLPLIGSGAAATSPGMTVYNANAGITNTSGDAKYPALGIGEYYWDGTGWVNKNAAIVKTDYLQAQTAGGYTITPTNSTNFTFSSGNATSAGGNISVTTNTVTLQPGRTYRLSFTVGDISAATSSALRYQFFDIGTSSFVGSPGYAESLSARTSVGAICEAVVSPTVVTTLVARCTIIGVVSTQFGVYSRSNITITTLP
jgi:hypothetical protein